MPPGIRVLCVDDDPDVRERLAAGLERREPFEVLTAEGGRDGLAALEDDAVDCIVSDYEMPGTDGLAFLESVRERDPALPFLLVADTRPAEIASEALAAGATDYCEKETVIGAGQFDLLATRIERAVETRRAERDLAAAERRLDRYRTLVETAADPMYELDETGTVTAVNEALVERLGYDRDRVVGADVTELFPAEAVEAGTEALRRAIETGATDGIRFESVFETSGEQRTVAETNIAPRFTADGEFAGSVAVVREITRHRERERELAEYETILETAPFGLFVLNADGTIAWLNDEYAASFAERKDDLLGMEFPELVERGYYRETAIDRYLEDVRTLLSSDNDQEKATYNVHFHGADGDERIYDVHTKLLPLEDGEFAGTIHALRDVTQERHYRRELERQNERLEEFASLVSHDLRNPLNVAQGHLEFIDEGDDDHHVEKLAWSLSRIEELVEGLLQLARQGKTIGDREWIPLARVTREAWSTVDTGDATLEIETDVSLYGDEARVRELLENLFRNAVEHGITDPDSSPSDGGDRGDRLVVTVGSIGDDPRPAGFYVEDTGPGLPDDRESLFEFGYTTAADGTGFGLAIVEEIADAHGWTVDARDGDDGGARFEIRGITVPTDGAKSMQSA